MDQIQHQHHDMATYVQSLRLAVSKIVLYLREQVVWDSWVQHHLQIVLSSLDEGLNRLDDNLSRAHQQELGKTIHASGDGCGIEAPPAILQSCEATINLLAADTGTAVASNDGALNIKLAWVGAAISFCVNTATSPQDVLLRLSFFRPDPPDDFRIQTQDLIVMRSSQLFVDFTQRQDDEPISEDAVSLWLSPFLRLKSYEPGEYYQERFAAELMDKAYQGLPHAATEWPLYAEHFWPSVEDKVLALFAPSPNFGFMNWILYFVREMWPGEFGWHTPSKHPTIDLTDALCRGEIGPLHIAAAFALPSLCDQLISMGADVNETGALGTPLWCALVGPDILVNCMAGKPWQPSSGRHFASPYRSPVIKRLLDARADCSDGSGIENTQDERISVSGMAFWVSLKTGDESVLQRIIEAGPVFNQALTSLIEALNLDEEDPHSRDLLSRLLTILFDQCVLAESSTETQGLGAAISEAMSRLQLDLNPVLDNGKLGILDEELNHLAVSAIVGEDAWSLRRCVLDPRFHPGLPTNKFQRQNTLLHIAVADDFFEAVDILVEAGANLGDLDEDGKTPLMVVESVAMMERLVLTHGAITTHSDPDGRTIWHLAAATNELGLLEWLCLNDPSRDINMNKKTLAGRTPLVEALLSTDFLSDKPFSKSGTEPQAAKGLLEYFGNRLSLSCVERPLTHLAVPWGDSSLLCCLRDLGADFSELDEDGWTALHWINVSATLEFTEDLIKLCPDVPYMSYSGLTAAEAVFQNTVLLHTTEVDGPHRSSHPSCTRDLSMSAYNRLLNPEMLRQCDVKGEGFWPRFCRNVLTNLVTATEKEHKIARFSIETALQCVLSKGIMADYETKTGLPGIICLEGLGRQTMIDETWIEPGTQSLDRFWNLKRLHRIIIKVLRNSSNSMKRLFWTTAACQRLLVECCVDEDLPILRLVCSKGGELEMGERRYSGHTVLEAAMAHFAEGPQEPLASLLGNTSVDQLNRHQMTIFNTIISVHDRHEGIRVESLLQFFIDRGMRVNPARDDGESLLVEALTTSSYELASMLVLHGAKLEPGRYGFGALIYAAHVDDFEALEFLCNSFGHLGRDEVDWGSLYQLPGDPPRNALHVAADAASRDWLRKALEAIPLLKEHINLITEEGGPIHVAMKRGDVQVAEVLVEYGADLTLRDCDELQGYTPLHHACRHYDRELLMLCIRKAPETIRVKDNQGKTPLTLATELGNDVALSMFRALDL
ncbi:unnamed protein product [Clonostachys rosea]|uniref:Uncharacterized protein n=1 Tax=Bionectria ochroleuca TaxID=29856 RepID=A0ABY6TR61_BIOOC|nr:unnamed protein product [Clonostachys rosea]